MSLSNFRWFILLCFLVGTIRINALSMVPARHSRRISNITETRPDGVSYEAGQYKTIEYLKSYYHGKNIDDFSAPGMRHIRIAYSSRWKAEQDHNFLRKLLEIRIDATSTWEIEVVGRGASLGNWTLLTAFIKHLPEVATVCETSRQHSIA
jgi:hypothetical protein